MIKGLDKCLSGIECNEGSVSVLSEVDNSTICSGFRDIFVI